MKIAILSVTEQGRKLSCRISELLEAHSVCRFCFHKHSDADAIPFTRISEPTADLFPETDAMIFICASGIAVRAIAPHIRTKTDDPAVLVLDENGKFVISLLSGHLGGANVLAEVLAERLDAVPVITTATDSGRKFSPDCFAEANDLLIHDMDAAKAIASAVLDGEMIGLYSDYPCQNLPPELSEGTGCRTGICISTDVQKQPFPVTLHLIPKNLVVGIGCRKGISAEKIQCRMQEAFASAGLSTERICAAASIDLKAEEAGLLAFCEMYRIPMHCYSAAELMAVEGEFTASDFVKQTTGADNICERSAVRCSGGRLILPKCAGNGVTIAAAEKPVMLDFEKRRQIE